MINKHKTLIIQSTKNLKKHLMEIIFSNTINMRNEEF